MEGLNQRQKDKIIDDHMRSYESSLQRSPIPKSPEGLRSCLNDKELLLLVWLSWRETEHPCGGILVHDEASSGTTLKTIIALVMKEKNAQDATARAAVIKSNTTLIICKKTDLKKCEQVANDSCQENKLQVLTHHGVRSTDATELIRYDLVITTYETIAREPEPLFEEQGLGAATDPATALTPPVLEQVNWKRIVLINPEAIKTLDKSVSAKVFCKLKARARWAMTLKEDLLWDVCSIFRFLRCPPFDEKEMLDVLKDDTAETGRWKDILQRALFYRVNQG